MNGWRRKIPELRWSLAWLASGGLLCLSLLGEAAEEDLGRSRPNLLASSTQGQPFASSSAEVISDTPEAPWIPPPVSSAEHPASIMPSGENVSRPADGGPSAHLKPSDASFFLGPKTESAGGWEVGEESLSVFSPPPPAPSHHGAKKRDLSDSASAGLPQAVLMQNLGTPVFHPLPVFWGQQRPAHFERIARQADQHTRRGFELAGRRAYFSARAEFLSGVRLIAEGLDQYERSHRHSEALTRGLTALEEADDFLAVRSGAGEIFDLRAVASGHTTPVLAGDHLERLTAMEAMQRYLTYAQEQLAVACGEETAGSMALHGLGKLYAAMGEDPALGLKAAPSKALVFYQAALLVDPYNFMAANDLGVLLARGGWYEEAQAALSHSLRVCSHPVGWRNLAIVYRQMGQYDLALAAAQQWRRLRQQEPSPLHPQAQSAEVVVQWVPPERFAAGPSDGLTPPTSQADVSPGGLENADANPKGDRVPSKKLGDLFSRSARPEKHSPPGPPQNQPGPILSSLVRGPLSLFRREPPGDGPRDASASTTSAAPSPEGNAARVETPPFGKSQF